MWVSNFETLEDEIVDEDGTFSSRKKRRYRGPDSYRTGSLKVVDVDFLVIRQSIHSFLSVLGGNSSYRHLSNLHSFILWVNYVRCISHVTG